ncbi:MAG: sugar transferase, partial [Myxococcota bacterium]|nr:sugar transferase [Myxococcota bacterium]
MKRFASVGAIVALLDLVAIVASQWAAHRLWTWWRPHLEHILQIQWWELWLPNPFMPFGVLLAATWLVVLQQQGLYDPRKMTSSVRIVGAMTRATTYMLVAIMLIDFLLPDRTFSRFLTLTCWGSAGVFITTTRLAVFRLQSLLPNPIPRQRVCIVGLGQDALQMAQRLDRFGHRRYTLTGFLRPSWDPDFQRVPPDQVLGALTEFQELVNTHDIHVIVIATRTVPREEALQLATQAHQMGLGVLQVPFTWGMASPRVALADLGDLRLVDLTALDYPTLAKQLKRTLDLVLVGLGSLVLLPLLGIVAAAVKLHDGGPILFAQPRVGRGGRIFPLYKFRSMVVDA